ncbi:hypothetical protein HETIRDRAFT_122126 [Heterobasidion irregulare TC 32-1]|uniref:Dihydroxyacetone kinase n=1 Tax=Heterobasidion irregulare (strain TC 32-1) TaxID=747525 RepID=W4KKJ3_HETIT|nr:uncharacterized protein HETIRDRAFT_122126 [Heterobasidion irregulare TC 32-1]ETW86239.1 hypothetical protein HETIRDRAFT_122126 [Heterobasidion irregulare TC 32-1]
MSNKHVFNSPQGLVLKSLRGAAALNPTLRLHAPSKSVYVAHPSPQARVAVIAGGGAGHEPAHASYTGRGMLAASVSGDIFASPSARQILAAIELALLAAKSSSSGASDADLGPRPHTTDVLLIINNYTGDRINFGLAIARARALYPDVRVESIVVADDVSLLREEGGPSLVGPRGLAGNILVCKVLGAYAETGAGLDDVKRLGEAIVAGALASIGVGLEHCHVPGRSIEKVAEDTGDGNEGEECEVGMGLHNEPGVRCGRFASPEGLITEMLEMVLISTDGAVGTDHEAFVEIGKTYLETDETVLFVNNLGGMSQLEMGALLDDTLAQLEANNINPRRIYSSAYMTSLNAPGFSISLLNLSRIQRTLIQLGGERIDILALLDTPTDAHAWVGVRAWPTDRLSTREEIEAESEKLLHTSAHHVEDQGVPRNERDEGNYWRDADISVSMVEAGIRAACASALDAEKELTVFDTIVGDGDCGETFAAGARAVLKALDDGELEIKTLNPSQLIGKLSEILEDSMGGTIGALLAIFFTSLSTAVPTRSTGAWYTAPSVALEALSEHTPARPGDRTIVDALAPFCSALAGGDSLMFYRGMSEAVRRAREGAESTRGMKARLGRAVYVGEGDVRGLPPDPGAWGVAAVLEGLWQGMCGA